MSKTNTTIELVRILSSVRKLNQLEEFKCPQREILCKAIEVAVIISGELCDKYDEYPMKER